MKNGALPRRLVADTEGPLVLPSWMDTPSGAPQAPPRLEGGRKVPGLKSHESGSCHTSLPQYSQVLASLSRRLSTADME